MNNEIFYSELKNACENISDRILSKEEKEAFEKETVETGMTIVELSNVARKEGLLELEESSKKLPKEKFSSSILEELFMLIVDGTDPQIIRHIGMSELFANGYKGYEALQYLICLSGALSIQAGENPRVIEEEIAAMMPGEIKAQYRQRMEEYREGKKGGVLLRETRNHKQDAEDRCKRLESQEFGMTPEDNGYYIAKLTDFLFTKLDDRTIQRILREVENYEIEAVVKVLSGSANKAILGNLTTRIRDMITESVVVYCYSKKTSAEGAKRVLETVTKLYKAGEISFENEKLIGAMFEMFSRDYDVVEQRKKERQQEVKDIQDMLNDFCNNTREFDI